MSDIAMPTEAGGDDIARAGLGSADQVSRCSTSVDLDSGGGGHGHRATGLRADQIALDDRVDRRFEFDGGAGITCPRSRSPRQVPCRR